jgi:hypothetical protein
MAWVNGPITLYHGTTGLFANGILTGGVSLASVLSLKFVISGIRNLHLVRFGAPCEAFCH